MGNKDIISKQVLANLAADMANTLLHLNVDKDSVELLETEYQRVELRRADLVARMRKRDSGETFILHVEIQNANHKHMATRMLRYFTDIHFDYPDDPVHQHLIYIGKDRLRMASQLQQANLQYRYNILDMHTVDCEVLIQQDTPDALVLAILCDFKQRPVQDVVNYIVKRLKQLTADDESSFRNYFKMLETLADNRDLKTQLDEAKHMLTNVDVKNFASYQWGVREGEEIGKQKGRLEGRQEERTANNRKFALVMLNNNVDITVISQSTGMSIAELEALRDEQTE